MKTLALIWTRACRDWPADKKLLEKTALPYLHLPCLQLVPEKLSEELSFLSESKQQSFVFSSSYGVRFALQHRQLSKALQAQPRILAIGAATRHCLQQAGLSAFWPPQVQDGQQLSQYILAHIPKSEELILPGARQRAYDLESRLVAEGYVCHRLDLYRNEIGFYDSQSGLSLSLLEKQRLLAELGGLVCFASPSAVEGFVAGLKPSQIQNRFAALAIGQTTAKACQGFFAQIYIAPEPNFDTLVQEAVRVWPIFTATHPK